LNALASPAFVAAVAALLALVVHPALGLATRVPLLAPALGLLFVASLVARAGASRARLVLALGAVVAVTGLAFDALRGVSGVVELAPGESATRLSELGPDGREIGLRPLGFSLRLADVDAAGALQLEAQGPDGTRHLRVSRSRAATFGGLRFGSPVWQASDGAGALRLAVTRGADTQEVTLADGGLAMLGDLEIALERYFPDFALDAQRQPFSRSNEPRNPGALLHVKRGAEEFRVFVLQALPGIHRQSGLDASFALLGIDSPRVARLAAASEPAAGVVAAGLLLMLAGLLLEARSLADPADVAGGAGAALLATALLAIVDGGGLLRSRLGLETATGRVELRGAGLPLACALLAGLAAFLLLALACQTGRAAAARRGRGALVLAAGLASLGAVVAVMRALALPEPLRFAAQQELAVVGAAALVALIGAGRLLWPAGTAARLTNGLVRAAPVFLCGVVVVAGVVAFQRAGAYDRPAVAAAASAALLTLAAVEPTAASRALAAAALVAVAWLAAS
jgi:hypothetical protein